MTSRAGWYPSLTAGTSSQRSRASLDDSSAPSSQPNVTTREARSTSARVTCRGRRPRTSMPSPRSPWTTLGGISASGSSPAQSACTATPRCWARRRKCSRALGGSVKAHEEHRRRRHGRLLFLLHEDPFRLEQRECDEPDDRRGGHEQGIADLPAEQDHEAPERDERGEPVADRNLSE